MKKLIIIFMLLIATPMFGGVTPTDSTNNRIDIADGADVDFTSAMTVNVWINSVDTDVDDRFLSKWDGANGWIFRFDGSPTVAFYLDTLAGGVTSITTSEGTNTGQWFMVTGTYDESGGSNNHKLYIDGVERSTGTKTSTISTNAEPLRLSGAESGDQNYNGSYGGISLWDVALSASEILALFNSKNKLSPCQIQPVNLVGDWRLDECADGSSCTGVIFKNICGSTTLTGTVIGTVTGRAEEVLTY